MHRKLMRDDALSDETCASGLRALAGRLAASGIGRASARHRAFPRRNLACLVYARLSRPDPRPLRANGDADLVARLSQSRQSRTGGERR